MKLMSGRQVHGSLYSSGRATVYSVILTDDVTDGMAGVGDVSTWYEFMLMLTSWVWRVAAGT